MSKKSVGSLEIPRGALVLNLGRLRVERGDVTIKAAKAAAQAMRQRLFRSEWDKERQELRYYEVKVD